MNTNREILLKEFTSNEIQLKRMRKELDYLTTLDNKLYNVTCSIIPIGFKIRVDITSHCLIENECQKYANDLISVVFDVMLGEKFPFNQPKFYCKNHITSPSIADGRDLLEDILQKHWSPANLLSEIIVQIPGFLKSLQNKDKMGLHKMGCYHNGDSYNLSEFQDMMFVTTFQGNEIIDQKKKYQRYILITESNLLNFELVDTKKNIIKLISWFNLLSLTNVKKKQNEIDTIILNWKNTLNSENQQVVEQCFQIENSGNFIELLISNMKKFGAKVCKNVVRAPDLSLEDVTQKSYEKFNIQQILNDINLNESELEASLSLEIVEKLMTLYQKAIEYYSAFNNPDFQNFVDRLHKLLKREDVSAILQSSSQSQSKEQEVQKQDIISNSKIQYYDNAHNTSEISVNTSIKAKQNQNIFEAEEEEKS